MRTLAPLLAAAVCLACKPAPSGEAAREAAPAAPAATGGGSRAAAPGAALRDPERVAEKEPNDTAHTAQRIPARAVVSGAFAPTGKHKIDDDYFAVDARAANEGPLALQIDVSPADLDATLEVLDRDRNRVFRARRSAGEALGVKNLACKERCFVHLAGAQGSYTLSVLGAPPDAAFELEPNDRAVDANALTASNPLKGLLSQPGDLDWFKLAVPPAQPGQFARVGITGVPGVRLGLEAHAADGALLGEWRGSAEGEPLGVRDLAAAPPTLFLVVKSAFIGRGKRGANAKDAYAITASIEQGPPDLEVEPNDDPQHATLLGPSLTASGWLAPAGDVDWYRVRAAQPSILRVEVSGVERADLELSVWSAPANPNEKPQLLARANEGGLKEGEVLPAVGVPAGDALIKVESALREVEGVKVRDTADDVQMYKLTAQLAPDDGTSEREPNDAAHPQLVPLPATLRGFIWPHRDVDVFAFRVADGRAPLTFKVTAVRGVDLQLILRDAKAEIIGTADAVKGEGEEQIVAVPLRAGDYTIEVSSPRGKDASATQPYTLTIQ